MSTLLEDFRRAYAGKPEGDVAAVETFLAFVRDEIREDPVIGVNFSTGDIMRKSGRVLGRLPIQTTLAPAPAPWQIGPQAPAQSVAWPHATSIGAPPRG